MGFVTAGLGLLGLRPLDRAISPLLVMSSALSLVAIWRFGDPALWWGGAIDVALLLVGLWRAPAGWPAHPQHGRVWHALGLACGFAFLTYVALATVLWPWHRTWGSTAPEMAMSLPGDVEPRRLGAELQHAVTIAAPPGAVWPWLLQLGQGRAGFYSYDWLERAFGIAIHNVPQIRPEWQQRAVGDFVRATQPTYLAGVFGSNLGWTIDALEENHAMVLDQWGAFVLVPTEDGGTRFIIRSRFSQSTFPVWAAGLEFMAFELPHFIMERQMMLGIKELAERSANLEAFAR